MEYTDFGTFIVAPLEARDQIKSARVPRKWRLTVRPDPSGRHFCDNHGPVSTILSNARFDGSRGVHNNGAPADELLIQTRDQSTAERVQSLIHCGTLLTYPDLFRAPKPPPPYPVADLPVDLLRDSFGPRFHEHEHVGYGCLAAAAAWDQPPLVYALEKFWFSLELDWFTPKSADPIYRQKFPNSYEAPSYHVTAAFAIVAAFSVVEELGLEIRSSAQTPRFLTKQGPWNPRVLEDVSRRLNAAGIDPTDTFPWIRRGRPTQVEREMIPKLGKPSPWNRQYGVRDRDLTLPEAIHYVSWLRNFIASHKFRATTSAISPYDVHNAQGIARRLLLARLGIWQRLISRLSSRGHR